MSDVSRERNIHFNALPEDVRKRLVEVFAGTGFPSPLAADRASLGWDLTGWSTLLLLGGGMVGLMAWWGLGDSYEGWAVQGLGFVPLYFIAFFLAFWSILRAIRRTQLSNRLPFQAGRYLLPADFIDAGTAELRILPMGDLADFSGTHHHTNGAYTHTELNFLFVGGKTENFTIHGKEQAEYVLAEIASTGRQLAQAAKDSDIGTLAEMDPFLEARMSDVWERIDGAGEPASRPQLGPVAGKVGLPFRRAAIVATVLSLFFGLPFQLVRNVASDEIMYSDLQSTTSTWQCEAYLRNGWRHADEVRTTLLPAAAFRDATERHTVGAMRGFLTEFPNSAHEVEARAAIHTYYVQAMEDFKTKASTDNPEAIPFMSDLLGWIETHDDPAVEVRFMPPSNETLVEVDEMINDPEEKLWDGPIAPVSANFSDTKSKLREKSITSMLQEGFEQVFPNDVLTLEQGVRMGGDDWDKPVTKPTILVAYGVGPSGDIYTSDESSRAYVGIIVDFYVEMRVPESDKIVDFEMAIEPPEVFSVGPSYLSQLMASDRSAASSSDDANVYDTMALRAFDQLGAGVRRALFRQGVGDLDVSAPKVPDLDLGIDGGLSPEDLDALLKMLEDGNF